jgi:hypothetical protein
MAAITSSAFAKALYPGVSAWFGKSYAEFPVEYTQLFDTYNSRRRYEEDVGTSGFGLATIKDEGDGVQYDDAKQGITTRYQHATVAIGFIVTREAKDDDLYDVVAKTKSEGLAFSLRQTKEVIAANVYNRAFNTSYLGGDGSSLIASAGGGGSSTHPNVAGGTYTNGPSTASDLSEASLEQACIDIMKYTNDRGLRISVIPQTLHVPVDLVFEAERILKTEGRIATANNDLNALKNMGKFPGGIKTNHYLTDTDAWFIRTNVPHGMKHWVRRGMELTIDNDFDTENAKFKATERYSFGFTDPRGVYGSPGV